MRIIAGAAKGRRLVSPKGTQTRPLTGRTKEALFSSLGPSVKDARVLDLFAGSGSIGLEALSRGATDAVFVEMDRAAIDALHKNVDAVGLGGQIVDGDASYPERYAAGGEYDMVFVDPPYAMSRADVASIVGQLDGMVSRTAIIIVHRRAGDEMPDVIGSLSATSQRRYGDSELWRYEPDEEVPE